MLHVAIAFIFFPLLAFTHTQKRSPSPGSSPAYSTSHRKTDRRQGGGGGRKGSPTTKLIASDIHIPPRLIPRINTREQLMRLGHHARQHAVHMSRELLETSLGAIKAMDVDEEESAFTCS